MCTALCWSQGTANTPYMSAELSSPLNSCTISMCGCSRRGLVSEIKINARGKKEGGGGGGGALVYMEAMECFPATATQ